jgi:hypothetical protein
MESEFFAVSTEVRRYMLESATEASVNLRELLGSLKRWERTLRAADQEMLPLFYDRYTNEMNRVAFSLQSIKVPEVTGFYDRIFRKMFRIGKRVPTHISRRFEEFVKGITYLKFQTTIEVPVYHRLQSCGPGDDAFRKEFEQCTPDMQRMNRDEIKRRIETCYVERLIYDELYKYYTLHFPQSGTEQLNQDEGHVHRLELTKKDFRSCFPNIDMKVDIEYDMDWPVSLRIVKLLHGDIVSVEVYIKYIVLDETHGKFYGDVVDGHRITKQNRYVRTQSFEFIPNWKRLQIASEAGYDIDTQATRLHAYVSGGSDM